MANTRITLECVPLCDQFGPYARMKICEHGTGKLLLVRDPVEVVICTPDEVNP